MNNFIYDPFHPNNRCEYGVFVDGQQKDYAYLTIPKFTPVYPTFMKDGVLHSIGVTFTKMDWNIHRSYIFNVPENVKIITINPKYNGQSVPHEGYVLIQLPEVYIHKLSGNAYNGFGVDKSLINPFQG